MTATAHYAGERDLVLVFVLEKNLPAGGGQRAALADLWVRDVRFALGKLAERLSTRSVRLARMILIQAIRKPCRTQPRESARGRASP